MSQAAGPQANPYAGQKFETKIPFLLQNTLTKSTNPYGETKILRQKLFSYSGTVVLLKEEGEWQRSK